jgi:hypothetical protein
MKVEITRACGHVETVEIFGKNSEREKKIKWYESTDCIDCYNSIGCQEVEMPYKDYKNNYADCKTKKDSYNKDEKTIIVYVPAKTEEDQIVEEMIEAGTPEEFAKQAVKMSSDQIEKNVNIGKEKLEKAGLLDEKQQKQIAITTKVIAILRKHNK